MKWQAYEKRIHGSWYVAVMHVASEGNVSTSWNKTGNSPYIRFSFHNIMFIVAKIESVMKFMS